MVQMDNQVMIRVACSSECICRQIFQMKHRFQLTDAIKIKTYFYAFFISNTLSKLYAVLKWKKRTKVNAYKKNEKRKQQNVDKRGGNKRREIKRVHIQNIERLELVV